MAKAAKMRWAPLARTHAIQSCACVCNERNARVVSLFKQPRRATKHEKVSVASRAGERHTTERKRLPGGAPSAQGEAFQRRVTHPFNRALEPGCAAKGASGTRLPRMAARRGGARSPRAAAAPLACCLVILVIGECAWERVCDHVGLLAAPGGALPLTPPPGAQE